MSQLIVFLALAFSIIIAIFAVQNTMPVAVTFLAWRADAVAVSVLVLISAALGALAMLLLGLAREVSLRWRHRAVANQLKQTQARVAALEANQPAPVLTGQPALSASSSGEPAETGQSVPAAGVERE
ncbi:MAG TPA: lipopolysaccharide assembly protein LapA domain-containing protein [Chloroflexota bacterium]|nr:lipopolysaccharide assembly protein LapA domain-containing protein [Chloroflexota bacterium]